MLELSFSENMLLTTLSFFTALMTSLAGAGGGTVLLAAMLQFMNPAEAIPVHGVIQFSSNLTRTWLLRKFVNWSIVIRFSILLPIGVYIGLQIFQNMDSDNIKNIIGIFILLALILQNLKFIKSFFVPYYAFYFIGLITGVLNILVGVIAPLLAVILKQSISEKKSIVGTLGYFGLIGNLLKIIGFSLIGFSFYEYIDTFLMIIPATLVGSRVGQLLLNKISNKIFMIIFQIILIGLAIRLLFI
ncbi:sulfite exporter TauE/SafE family protein [Alphaproteobacteria bacterium]|nr:sulfite exporter TauE/SafE family protein [Alphaproteobacteria bacterium]MDC1086569.1 sulfite exporter TauE/SafE family protein [Alphaproteobacteria bacterium]